MHFDEMAVGISTMLLVMLVHLMATFVLIDFVDPYENRFVRHPRLRLMVALVVANVVLLAAHLVEVGLWSLVYDLLGLVVHHEDAYYSAFVNYTALGYGDSLQQTNTRLLGPMTAGSGVLMFGWSTALIFQVIQRHLPSVTRKRAPRGATPAQGTEEHEATAGASSPLVRS